MDISTLILTVTMWMGVLLGLILGVYININAYKSKIQKPVHSIKSSVSVKGDMVDSYTVIYLTHRLELKKHKSVRENFFKGNLALKSEYESDDCFV